MNLFQLSFVLFALVASGGVLLTGLVASGVRFPSFIGTAHGVFALVSLCVLFAADLRGEQSTPVLAWWALVVFVSGFVGGMVLFRIIFRNRATLPLALMHGSLGAVGLFLLYRAAF